MAMAGDWFSSYRDRTPPYDGADPNTESEICCAGCHKDWVGKEGAHSPRLCSRCKVVRYCSTYCQREHFRDHKKECKNIKNLRDVFEAETTRMQSLAWGFGDAQENVLRTQVGRFWGIFETRDYCRARWSLFEAISDVAYWGEQEEQWEQALGHMLELLRLMRSDNLGIRHKVGEDWREGKRVCENALHLKINFVYLCALGMG